MEKNINFENLERKDLKKIELLQNEYIKEVNNIWTYHELLIFISKKESFSIVAKIKDRVLGFSLFLNTKDVLELYIIFVDPEYRRKGIGKKFIEIAITFCKKSLIKRIVLEVNESNEKAILLYKKLNFKKISVRKEYYLIKGQSFDASVMQFLV